MTMANITVTAPGDRDIVMTRVFHAPRRLVFDCYTKPELLKQWMTGPDGWALAVCDNDLRVGGSFRWVWRGPDRDMGSEMALSGVYLEIVAPERIVRTELFGGDKSGVETLGTLLLVENGRTTTVTTSVPYPSREVREAVLKSGMERGFAKSCDRLAALIAASLADEQPKNAA
jgi:uncharacterized protein YndB with AHSA1/START domain